MSAEPRATTFAEALDDAALDYLEEHETSFEFRDGAEWAHEQDRAERDRLVAANDRLRAALQSLADGAYDGYDRKQARAALAEAGR